MIKAIIVLGTMLAMLEVHMPAWVIISVMVYFSILFLILKTFQRNKL